MSVLTKNQQKKSLVIFQPVPKLFHLKIDCCLRVYIAIHHIFRLHSVITLRAARNPARIPECPNTDLFGRKADSDSTKSR